MLGLRAEEQIRDGCFRSTRGTKMGIGRTSAKAYAHRHAEVEMFPASATRITTVKATGRSESSRHRFRPPSGSPNPLRICSCGWLALDLNK